MRHVFISCGLGGLEYVAHSFPPKLDLSTPGIPSQPRMPVRKIPSFEEALQVSALVPAQGVTQLPERLKVRPVDHPGLCLGWVDRRCGVEKN